MEHLVCMALSSSGINSAFWNLEIKGIFLLCHNIMNFGDYIFHCLSSKYFTCRGGQTVAVVYFRAGYSPNDYPSESVSNIM